MALQGTIDAFPLTDVLQLLASSAKSGRLTLEGDRGRNEMWIDHGDVVGAGAGASTSAANLVFEMLRFRDGSFSFGDDPEGPSCSVEPVPLAKALVEAESLIEEWQRIEALVPSRAHRISLVPELTESTVTLDRQDWAVMVAVGDTPTVERLGERLDRDELSCGALVAALVERGVLGVVDPDIGSSGTELHALALVETLESSGEGDSLSGAVIDDLGAEVFPDRFPIDDLLGGAGADGSWGDDEDGGRFAAAQTLDAAAADPFVPFGGDLNERTAEAWDDVVTGYGAAPPVSPVPDEAGTISQEGADEVLRQMSRLSPKAAEAIAAALNTSGPSDSIVFESAVDDPAGDGPAPFLGAL